MKLCILALFVLGIFSASVSIRRLDTPDLKQNSFLSKLSLFSADISTVNPFVIDTNIINDQSGQNAHAVAMGLMLSQNNSWIATNCSGNYSNYNATSTNKTASYTNPFFKTSGFLGDLGTTYPQSVVIADQNSNYLYNNQNFLFATDCGGDFDIKITGVIGLGTEGNYSSKILASSFWFDFGNSQDPLLYWNNTPTVANTTQVSYFTNANWELNFTQFTIGNESFPSNTQTEFRTIFDLSVDPVVVPDSVSNFLYNAWETNGITCNTGCNIVCSSSNPINPSSFPNITLNTFLTEIVLASNFYVNQVSSTQVSLDIVFSGQCLNVSSDYDNAVILGLNYIKQFTPVFFPGQIPYVILNVPNNDIVPNMTNKTTLYILLGVGGLVLVAIGFAVFKKCCGGNGEDKETHEGSYHKRDE